MVSFTYKRKAPPLETLSHIPPTLSLFWWNYHASTEIPQWWLPYIRVPLQTTHRGILNFLGYSIGFTCVWMYILGIILLAALLSGDTISFARLLVVGYITIFISLSAGTTINATDGEFLWIVKWTLLNGESFTSEEIQKVLDGDGGVQSVKNLVVGPRRARMLSLYLLLTRTGPRVGLAFLASSYEVFYMGTGFYKATINWAALIGGLILVVVIQAAITIISVLSLKRGSIVPPNTALALSLALKPCLKPLGDAGGTAGTSDILKALKEKDYAGAKYSLQLADVQGAPVAQFTLAPGEREPYATTAKLKKLEKKTKLFYTSSNFFTGPLLPCILSLVVAAGVYSILKWSIITETLDLSQYLKVKGLGTIRNKLLLSLVLQLYSLLLGSFSDSIIHTVRWGCISSNKTNITAVESLLAGNNFWNLSSFSFFCPGAFRGWVCKIIGAFQLRAMITTIGWATLMNYYQLIGTGGSRIVHVGSGGRILELVGWNITAIITLCMSFVMVLAMWTLCAGTLVKGQIVPEGNSLPKAHAFRRLVAQLETTGSVDKEVRYGRIVSSSGELATAVSGSAEPFMAGTYI
ncbi:hypothetical protein TWF481_003209 [Arthrobotrys musiformis]|uniref:Uncharacterized protein n=1 Tax=Arthrobotrys musiformis TaxID=47236 RepID=A0AAV9VQT4_9PEZI